MRSRDNVRAPWWPNDPPQCSKCGAWHHSCDCIAREAAKRVKVKRALRQQGVDLAQILQLINPADID